MTKVMQPPWLANAKGAWEVGCDRVYALKDFYMVLMASSSSSINYLNYFNGLRLLYAI